MRTHKVYSWKELITIRDSLQVLSDTLIRFSREWDYVDNFLTEVSEEIDFRYKHNIMEG